MANVIVEEAVKIGNKGSTEVQGEYKPIPENRLGAGWYFEPLRDERPMAPETEGDKLLRRKLSSGQTLLDIFAGELAAAHSRSAESIDGDSSETDAPDVPAAGR